MCDPSAIIGQVIGGVASSGAPALPWQTTATSIGRGIGQLAPLAKTGFDVYSATSAAKAEAKASGKRAGQIDYASTISTQQAKQAQERRIGANRAAYAKSGVNMSGTATRLIEEQVKQDDIELLKIRYARDLGIDEERKATSYSRLKRDSAIGAALSSDSFLGSVSDIFGLGK